MSSPEPEPAMDGWTESVCPTCLERIPARRVEHGHDVYLEKECRHHGAFRKDVGSTEQSHFECRSRRRIAHQQIRQSQ